MLIMFGGQINCEFAEGKMWDLWKIDYMKRHLNQKVHMEGIVSYLTTSKATLEVQRRSQSASTVRRENLKHGRRGHRFEAERERRRASARAGRILAATGAAIGATVLFAPEAQADDFVVDTLQDGFGGGSNDCSDADCRLREAVVDANLTPGGDSITFASGLSGTLAINPVYGAIYIGGENYDGGLSIQGPGADQITISADNQSGIFKVLGFNSAGQDVSISGLALTQGDAEGSSFGGGGAISNSSYYNSASSHSFLANLNVSDVVITESSGAAAGAILSAPEPGTGAGAGVTIDHTQIVGNDGTQFSGGVFALGPGSMEVTESRIADNDAGIAGGGILFSYGEDSAATLADSTVSGNTAAEAGSDEGGIGGILLANKYGDAVVSNSTISGNQAEAGAGGLASYGGRVEQSTISGNQANTDANELGDGGGIVAAKYELAVTNSTVSDNSAAGGGGIYLYDDDPDPSLPQGAVSLSSTIVGNNAARQRAGPPLRPLLAGSPINHSLIENTAGGADRRRRQQHLRRRPPSSGRCKTTAAQPRRSCPTSARR